MMNSKELNDNLLKSLGFENVNNYSVRVMPLHDDYVFNIKNNSQDKDIISIHYLIEDDNLVVKRCIVPKKEPRKVIELCTEYVSEFLSINISEDLMKEIESELKEIEK